MAEVIARLLLTPSPPTGRVYELTGAESRDMTAIAAELSAALGRPVTYVDVPYKEWLSDLEDLHLPPHVFDHIATMARLHRQNRYNRVTNDIADLLGRSPSAFTSFVQDSAALRDAGGPGPVQRWPALMRLLQTPREEAAPPRRIDDHRTHAQPERRAARAHVPRSGRALWELLTTAAGLEEWFAPDGFETRVSELEVKPGGQLQYTMTATAPEQVAFMRDTGNPLSVTLRKTFTDDDPPTRLAYLSLIDFIPGRGPLRPGGIDIGARQRLRRERGHDEG